jgi:ATP-dependent Lon protease
MSGIRIPIFPLELVLFPEMALPLHIFEPRYRLMIRRCLDAPSEFGVVLARASGIATYGCTAEIAEVTKDYGDGRVEIVTEGRSVFRVLEVFSDRPYQEADVELLPDADSPRGGEPAELVRAYEQCHRIAYGHPPKADDRAGAASLAYYIAADLPLELDDKQALLELRSEHARRALLLQRLQELLPALEQKYRIREKARSNGHGQL